MRLAVLAAFASAMFASLASAGSLQVAPVIIDVAAPGAAATITLRNSGNAPLAAQLRIYRWTQDGGEERLDSTEDVVVSPPAVELRPQQDYVVRIVRITKQPVMGEESYRLLVDELPDPLQTSGVQLVMRHSLPVFFDGPGASPAEPVWTLARSSNGLTLSVANHGDRRIRLSALSVGEGGHAVSFGGGLVGYALGRSTMRFATKAKGQIAAGGKIPIKGNTEQGSFNALAVLQAAR
ncbi:fimbrial chaperone protein [Rhizobiales bacterium GAS191]|nr:fimbrial chaperone protein [Rhizobiales bacterium GAS113]SEE96138.1 fimbrial chaperone protein [Rhizobiales bacterium GAS191]